MRVTINRLNVLADALLNNAPSWIDSTLDITSNDDETQLEIDVDYFVFKIRRPRTPILSWWSDGVDGTKQMSRRKVLVISSCTSSVSLVIS